MSGGAATKADTKSEGAGAVAPAPLLPVEDARARIVRAMRVLEAEPVELKDAAGRIAAEDVRARYAPPPTAISAMDGYSLRSADVRRLPARLRQVGVSRAGARFAGTLGPGNCVRIFTGATLPPGADTIALQEDTTEHGDTIEIREVGRVNQHVRAAGLDFPAGEICVPRGRRLRARDIGIVAACGHAQVLVQRKPRIAILSTGDELVAPGVPAGPDQIVGSNGVALAAAVIGWGADVIELGIAPDQADAIAAAVDRAAGADLLVTTGGASVGDHDLVRSGVAMRAFAVDFWRIAMRPGKPLMFGRVGDLPVLSMPGNPVSALVCALLFLKPAILAMSGVATTHPEFEPAVLGAAMAANDKREDYVRARLVRLADGTLIAQPFPTQDSSMQLALAHADALVRRAAFAPAAPAGARVDVIRLDLPAGGF